MKNKNAKDSENNQLNRLRELATRGDYAALVIEAEMTYAQINEKEENIELAGEALFLCGFGRGELGDRGGAIQAYEKALDIGFKAPGLLFNLGNSYREMFEPQKALACYQGALSISPHRGDVIANMAFVYEDLGDIERAEACYMEGARLFPDHNDAVCNAGYSLLRRGQYQQGWTIYERRKKSVPHQMLDPNWQVGQAVFGKKIIVSVEQGYGDILMFAGLLEELSKDAAEVVLVCDERLEKLLKRSLRDVKVQSRFEPEEVRNADFVIGLASLGYLYRNVEQRAFKPIDPYLKVDQKRAKRIEREVRDLPGRLKVGIAWRGGKDERNKRRRCIDPVELLPLLRMEDVCWINLQHHAPKEDLEVIEEEYGVKLYQIVDATEDLDGLAATVSCLDDIVTVQQTLVHFAGASGTPAGVLIPAVPEWRYGMDGKSMPWWKSVELIRQSKLGDWTSAVSQAQRRIRQRLDTEK